MEEVVVDRGKGRGRGNKEQSKGGGRDKDMKQRPCINFLMGDCTRGDDCRYGHISAEELNKMKAQQDGHNKHEQKHDGGQTPNKKKEACLQFANLGRCQQGDKCPFDHSEKNKGNNKRTFHVDESEAECLNYAEYGYCHDKECPLKHTNEINMVEEDAISTIETDISINQEIPKFEKGEEVIIINVPEGSALAGLEARIAGQHDSAYSLT